MDASALALNVICRCGSSLLKIDPVLVHSERQEIGVQAVAPAQDERILRVTAPSAEDLERQDESVRYWSLRRLNRPASRRCAVCHRAANSDTGFAAEIGAAMTVADASGTHSEKRGAMLLGSAAALSPPAARHRTLLDVLAGTWTNPPATAAPVVAVRRINTRASWTGLKGCARASNGCRDTPAAVLFGHSEAMKLGEAGIGGMGGTGESIEECKNRNRKSGELFSSSHDQEPHTA